MYTVRVCLNERHGGWIIVQKNRRTKQTSSLCPALRDGVGQREAKLEAQKKLRSNNEARLQSATHANSRWLGVGCSNVLVKATPSFMTLTALIFWIRFFHSLHHIVVEHVCVVRVALICRRAFAVRRRARQ
jgi:hypothetical protein